MKRGGKTDGGPALKPTVTIEGPLSSISSPFSYEGATGRGEGVKVCREPMGHDYRQEKENKKKRLMDSF